MNRAQKQARATEYLAAYALLATIRPPSSEEKAAAHNARRLLEDAPLFIPEFLR